MATYVGKQLKLTDEDGNIFKLIPVDSTEKGIANGVATLNANGKVPSSQLPLPSDPSSDGTYFLQCAVSSGSASYNWVTIPAASGVNF